MMLLEIRDHLRVVRSIAVRDIALKFNISQDEAISMLEHWVKKGQVRKQPVGSLCQSSCRRCDPSTIQIYEWIGPSATLT